MRLHAVSGPILALTTLLPAQVEHASSIPNGGFERIAEGRPAAWGALWTREEGIGNVSSDTQHHRSGLRSARIEHRGTQDWSFSPAARIPVRPGDVLRLETWVRIEGLGSATLCAVAYDADGRVLQWTAAASTLRGSREWTRLESRLVVTRGIERIAPRVIGAGPATVWLDDFAVTRAASVLDRTAPPLDPIYHLENDSLRVSFLPETAALEVLDKRIAQRWRQLAPRARCLVVDVVEERRSLECRFFLSGYAQPIRLQITLEKQAPEFTLQLEGKGPLDGPLAFPHPFATAPDTRLIVPLNEGIAYPVDDAAVREQWLQAYGGHGLCMSFWGQSAGAAGHLAIIETPDDMRLALRRRDGLLRAEPSWEPQKGHFGYPRRLRYTFFARGDHVAMCKRYRAHARSMGLLRTLAEKRAENRRVDDLIGAAIVWYWGRDAVEIARELRAAGIERILWSHRQPPDILRALNTLPGVLTSRYDIYQDLMDPQLVATRLSGVHPDWTQRGFPEHIMLDERGRPREGWRVRARDGELLPCSVLCDQLAPAYARERIAAELRDHPYRCRFIDTTTASPWRECYHPEHPQTRSESKRAKMELLRVVSREMLLVTGSETGHDAAVPHVHYFEGMLSLGPYRVPNAGRDMLRIWDEVPEPLARFQLGHRYRLPLWELVYHDCVVATWYWGDYSNKLPALWSKRDLFNLLYATPPMYMFTRRFWEANSARFAESYHTIAPLVRAVGYSEMLAHRFLTSDRDVQQTRFSSGHVVTVNFSSEPRVLADGTRLDGLGYRIQD